MRRHVPGAVSSADVTIGNASLGASYSKSRTFEHTISSPRVATYSKSRTFRHTISSPRVATYLINPTTSYVDWASG